MAVQLNDVAHQFERCAVLQKLFTKEFLLEHDYAMLKEQKLAVSSDKAAVLVNAGLCGAILDAIMQQKSACLRKLGEKLATEAKEVSKQCLQLHSQLGMLLADICEHVCKGPTPLDDAIAAGSLFSKRAAFVKECAEHIAEMNKVLSKMGLTVVWSTTAATALGLGGR